jgi:hypothetical protein
MTHHHFKQTQNSHNIPSNLLKHSKQPPKAHKTEEENKPQTSQTELRQPPQNFQHVKPQN